MSSVNKAIILGRLGRDPEVRYRESGDPVANLSLATSETWKDKAGEKQEKTEWHRVVFFGKVAEIAGKYLTKGSMAYIEGRITTRKWTDKDGTEKYSTEIVGDTLRLLGGGTGKPADGTVNQSAKQPAPQKQQKLDDNFDDDIPF